MDETWKWYNQQYFVYQLILPSWISRPDNEFSRARMHACVCLHISVFSGQFQVLNYEHLGDSIDEEQHQSLTAHMCTL